MKEKAEQNLRRSKVRSLLNRLAGDKKKTITAVCLLIVLALMWIRISIGKSSQDARADQIDRIGIDGSSSAADAKDIQPTPSVAFIQLPKIEGRNDRLARDFFTVKDDKPQVAASTYVVAKTSDEQFVRRIKSFLSLDAIEMGSTPRAFINNRLFKEGDKINISDGDEKFECIVEKIIETEVLLNCLETKIVLKLSNPLDVIEQQ